jgi:hypothetical protein
VVVKNKTKKEKGIRVDDNNNNLKDKHGARQSSLLEFIQVDGELA